MAKITSVIIGDTGTQAKDKINEAIETVETNTTLTGDGNVGTELAVNPDLVLDTLQFSGGSGTLAISLPFATHSAASYQGAFTLGYSNGISVQVNGTGYNDPGRQD